MLARQRLTIMPQCEKCGGYFPFLVEINGKKRNLKNRKYCLVCSPFGLHNTKNLVDASEPAEPIHPLPPSEDLAYLIGVISGDGSISRLRRVYKLAIACDIRYPDLIDRYTDLLNRVIGGKVSVLHRKDCRCADVSVYKSHLPELLGLPSGTKATNGYTVPQWIFDSAEFVRPFLRGLIETDGGVYRTYHKQAWFWYCTFTAKHEAIMSAFLRGTEMIGYRFRMKGITARLSISKDVKALIVELNIDKMREYRYD